MPAALAFGTNPPRSETLAPGVHCVRGTLLLRLHLDRGHEVGRWREHVYAVSASLNAWNEKDEVTKVFVIYRSYADGIRLHEDFPAVIDIDCIC